MKKLVPTFFAASLAFSLASQSALAQLPGRLRVPKVSVSKPDTPAPAAATPASAAASATPAPAASESSAAAKPSQPAAAANDASTDPPKSTATEPAVAKDSIQIRPFTFNVYKGNYDMWSWVPEMNFTVNGPIESGSQLYVAFNQPGAATPWVKFDCRTEPVQAGYWVKTECGGRAIPEDKGSTAIGAVAFTIGMRNELAGTDKALFKGRMKVAKVRSNEHGPKAVNKFVYYGDLDWNLPIGYVFYTPDDVSGWKRTRVNVAFWVRGDAHNFEPHLFFQGKEVGKVMFEGREIGVPSCSAEVEVNTTHYVEDTFPQKARWGRVRCTFYSIMGWDKTGEAPGMFGPLYQLAANPGEYEVKVLWNNKLARSIKFKVDAAGKLDFTLATNNKLGSNRAIVPVQIIGDQDGKWDRAAWKTEGFFGNPLEGFEALP